MCCADSRHRWLQELEPLDRQVPSPAHPASLADVLTVHAGTVKMGTDDGRSGGTSVVDTNTKVYGTDNIFVVDASIFPGHVTSNPTAAIMAVAEHAAVKIEALPFPAAS